MSSIYTDSIKSTIGRSNRSGRALARRSSAAAANTNPTTGRRGAKIGWIRRIAGLGMDVDLSDLGLDAAELDADLAYGRD